MESFVWYLYIKMSRQSTEGGELKEAIFFHRGNTSKNASFSATCRLGHKRQGPIGWEMERLVISPFLSAADTDYRCPHSTRLISRQINHQENYLPCTCKNQSKVIFFFSSGHRNNENSFYLRLLFNYEEVRDV